MPNPSLRTPLRASLRTLRVGLVAAVALCASSSALAQTVLKIGYTPPQGVALRRRRHGVLRRGREGHAGPLQVPAVPELGARRRARADRGGAARHAGPGQHLDRPGRQLRARDQDRRHPVPVPRLRPCAQGDGRPDRPGHAGQVPEQGHHRAGLDRERLPPHDQQQARHRQARRRRRPEDAHHGKQGAHGRLPHLRHPADADGLPRAVRRAAAGHGRRPGEPDPGDPVAPSSRRCKSTCR